MSIKCVCMGTDPVIMMKIALLDHGLGAHEAREKYGCKLSVVPGDRYVRYVCSRAKGHDGPCVACYNHGIGELSPGGHNLTRVPLPSKHRA